MDEQEINEVVEEKSQLPEAPISITIKGYYKGYSVMLTKRLDDDQLTRHIDGTTAVVQKMIEAGFKPSWNDDTNEKHVPEVTREVNPEECKHVNYKILEVKKDGPNKGKHFKTCADCKAFIGWA